MPTKTAIHLGRPINSVAVLNGYPGAGGAVMPDPVSQQVSGESLAALEQVNMHMQQAQQCCAVLGQAVERVNGVYEEIICCNHEAIARLSVEIARKVLAQTIRDGDYEIQAIIQEALKSAPDRTDVTIRLHPDDLHMVQQLQGDDHVFADGVKLIGDAAIGPCECVVETPKGIVSHQIDEHLEKIEKALARTG